MSEMTPDTGSTPPETPAQKAVSEQSGTATEIDYTFGADSEGAAPMADTGVIDPIVAGAEYPAPVAAESVKRETFVPAAVSTDAPAAAGAATLADAPVVPESAVPAATPVAPLAATPTEYVLTSPEPAAAAYAGLIGTRAPQTPIYVQAPTPPAAVGNRGGGILIALVAAAVFAGLFALVVFVISGLTSATVEQAVGTFSVFIVRPEFFIPVLFFFVAFSLLIAIVNRGGWWAYVLFGFLVAVVVYFSFIGGALLGVQAWNFTPSEAQVFINTLWLNPVAIAAAVIAREVPIWFGAWIAARGRKVTARNVEARQEYDRLIAAGPQLTPAA